MFFHFYYDRNYLKWLDSITVQPGLKSFVDKHDRRRKKSKKRRK